MACFHFTAKSYLFLYLSLRLCCESGSITAGRWSCHSSHLLPNSVSFKRLCLRGGECILGVPDDMPTMDKVMDFIESEQVEEARINFKSGEHKIGAEEYDWRAVRLEDPDLKLQVVGEKGSELSGHWKLVNGTGEFRGLSLLDLVKLAPDGFSIEHSGDNCISAEGGSWSFHDCEIQSSGTALRALGTATVLWERCITGGCERAKIPPSNYSTWKVPDFISKALHGLMHRDHETGKPLTPQAESSMPRYGVTSWGDAHVAMRDCTILNMTYNGVCCTGSSVLLMEDCHIKGCLMAGLYMEGDSNATVRRCSFQDNFVGISVWGGFGEERSFKTVSTWEAEEYELVQPNCSMRLENTHFTKRAWAGDVRPAHLEEVDNVYADEVDMSDAAPEDLLVSDDSLVEVEDKPGQKVRLWGMEEPITIPSWAPQDENGGDGVSFWTPASQTLSAGPPP